MLLKAVPIFCLLFLLGWNSLVAQKTAAITAAEYCEFLNAVATSDPQNLYDELTQEMEDGRWKIGPEALCILRSGTPGNYFYSVIQEKEDAPMTGISWFNATQYCNWKNNFSSFSEGSTPIFHLPSSIFNMDQCLKSNQLTFYLVSADQIQTAATSCRDSLASLGKMILGGLFFLTCANQYREAPATPLNHDIAEDVHETEQASPSENISIAEDHETEVQHAETALTNFNNTRDPHLRHAVANTLLGIARVAEVGFLVSAIPAKLYLLHVIYDFAANQLQSPVLADIVTGAVAFYGVRETYRTRAEWIGAIRARYAQIPTAFSRAYKEGGLFFKARARQQELTQTLHEAKSAQLDHYEKCLTTEYHNEDFANDEEKLLQKKLIFEARAHLLAERPPKKQAYQQAFEKLLTAGTDFYGSTVMNYALSPQKREAILDGARFTPEQRSGIFTKLRGVSCAIDAARDSNLSLSHKEIIADYAEEQLQKAENDYERLQPDINYLHLACQNTLRGLGHLSVVLVHMVFVPVAIGYAYVYIGPIGVIVAPIAYHLICSRGLPILRSALESCNERLGMTLPVPALMEDDDDDRPTNDPNHLPDYLKIPLVGIRTSFRSVYQKITRYYQVCAAKLVLEEAEEDRDRANKNLSN